tara:strand:+ start:284 stop:1129 length:846 start_codon:yes stop_codon:yes gene_type:complete
VFKKSFLLLFIFIYCGNSESLETTTDTIIVNDDLNIVSSYSSVDTTTTTLFNQFPVSSILKLSPTDGSTTTETVPQPIIGETTTTVPQTTTTVPQTTTTTTVPQTTTTTVPQTTTTVPQTTTTVPQTTTTVPQTTTTTTVPQTTTTVPQTTTTTTVPQTTTTTTTTTTIPQTITTIGVTVANNGFGSNVYFLNGNQDSTINVSTGTKYRFDLSDPSNSGHPLRFSTTQNGNEYNSNVSINGVAGNVGAYIEIEITSNTPNQLYIYCTNHFGMGGNTVITKS